MLVRDPEQHASVSLHGRHPADLRRDDDHPHRRRRHADRHLAAELLRRTLRRGHGLRARQQAADRGRRARRRVGLHPLGQHVEGHEPLVHQRAVRRLRTGAARGRRRDRKRVRCAAPRRKKRRRFSRPPTKSSSFPDTAWPSRRRSTRSANSTTRSASAAST